MNRDETGVAWSMYAKDENCRTQKEKIGPPWRNNVKHIQKSVRLWNGKCWLRTGTGLELAYSDFPEGGWVAEKGWRWSYCEMKIRGSGKPQEIAPYGMRNFAQKWEACCLLAWPSIWTERECRLRWLTASWTVRSLVGPNVLSSNTHRASKFYSPSILRQVSFQLNLASFFHWNVTIFYYVEMIMNVNGKWPDKIV